MLARYDSRTEPGRGSRAEADMGTGASAGKFALPKGDEAGHDGGDDIACEEDEDIELPKQALRQYAEGTVEAGPAQQELKDWWTKRMARDPLTDPGDLLRDALSALSAQKSSTYGKGIELLVSALPIADGETALKAAMNNGNKALLFKVMEVIPPEAIETLQDTTWLLNSALPSFFDFEGKWKFDFFEKELLPRAEKALLSAAERRDEVGRCLLLNEQFENQSFPAMACLISLGADITGVLTPPEAISVQAIYKQCLAKVQLWPTHQRLCKAIARGDSAEVKQILKEEADPNFDHVEGDASTATPLVLAMRKTFEGRWAEYLFGFKLPHRWDSVQSKSNLEVIKELLASPSIDPNRGAYSYGWHGSCVRLSPLGMAMIQELDTGSCYHNAQSDQELVAPRRDILQLFLDHPDTDLEHVYYQQFEEGEPEQRGALGLLDRDYRVGKDYLAAQMLMQAGALMTPAWKRNLEELDSTVKDLQAELEKSLEEEKEARPAELPEVEYQDDVEYTPHEKLDGELVVEGISLKPQFVGAKAPPLSAILQSRLKDMEGVKAWYSVVRKGSNVLTEPKSFPAAFCRVAAALRKAMGKVGLCKVLDFLEFFEFNRPKETGSRSAHTVRSSVRRLPKPTGRAPWTSLGAPCRSPSTICICFSGPSTTGTPASAKRRPRRAPSAKRRPRRPRKRLPVAGRKTGSWPQRVEEDDEEY
ncbi:unnamed protein product [Effrenium voratum]|uniref:Uncharacterized protein n=1 Tax=Effrenium voratum TaxID=2562239 RepID=A0AA36I1I6_9DINO|nr:unnamed protein product [Effrenium voratum]CAJ1435005.1 unnamed protein product [Effrenium voratum]